jgi:hypothetical protein
VAVEPVRPRESGDPALSFNRVQLPDSCCRGNERKS